MAMTKEHKEALARGRIESKAIKSYLRSIEGRRPGRPINEASLQSRLDSVNARLKTAEDPLQRLDLLQQRIELAKSLKALEGDIDRSQLEAEFVANALSYSERKGISYTAWRDYGVPAAVLKKAGIPETRRGAHPAGS